MTGRLATLGLALLMGSIGGLSTTAQADNRIHISKKNEEVIQRCKKVFEKGGCGAVSKDSPEYALCCTISVPKKTDHERLSEFTPQDPCSSHDYAKQIVIRPNKRNHGKMEWEVYRSNVIDATGATEHAQLRVAQSLKTKTPPTEVKAAWANGCQSASFYKDCKLETQWKHAPGLEKGDDGYWMVLCHYSVQGISRPSSGGATGNAGSAH